MIRILVEKVEECVEPESVNYLQAALQIISLW